MAALTLFFEGLYLDFKIHGDGVRVAELEEIERRDIQEISGRFVQKLSEDPKLSGLDRRLRSVWKLSKGFSDDFHSDAPDLKSRVIIGEAFADVASWFYGDGGAVVQKELLSRYPWLLDGNQIRLPFVLSANPRENILISYDKIYFDRCREALCSIAGRLKRVEPRARILNTDHFAGNHDLLYPGERGIVIFNSRTLPSPATRAWMDDFIKSERGVILRGVSNEDKNHISPELYQIRLSLQNEGFLEIENIPALNGAPWRLKLYRPPDDDD